MLNLLTYVAPFTTGWSGATLRAAHHSGVVVVGFDGQTGHRAVDPLLLLTPVAEPNPNHLLLHGELLGDERDLLRVGLRVLKKQMYSVFLNYSGCDQLKPRFANTLTFTL